jgi:hypothetical protein
MDQLHLLEILLDHMIPDGVYPGHRATHVCDRLAKHLRVGCKDAHPLMTELITTLQAMSRDLAGTLFETAPLAAQQAILCQLDGLGDPQFRSLQRLALSLHYSDRRSWAPLGFPNSPQPGGYPDHNAPPREAS